MTKYQTIISGKPQRICTTQMFKDFWRPGFLQGMKRCRVVFKVLLCNSRLCQINIRRRKTKKKKMKTNIFFSFFEHNDVK